MIVASFPTCLRTLRSTLYQQAIQKAGVKPGRFLAVTAAEYLSGLPLGWTSPRSGDVNVITMNRTQAR